MTLDRSCKKLMTVKAAHSYKALHYGNGTDGVNAYFQDKTSQTGLLLV